MTMDAEEAGFNTGDKDLDSLLEDVYSFGSGKTQGMDAGILFLKNLLAVQKKMGFLLTAWMSKIDLYGSELMQTNPV